jgi:hypothetical protein
VSKQYNSLLMMDGSQKSEEASNEKNCLKKLKKAAA